MEYRFQAVQELSTYITIFCGIMTLSLGIFFASLMVKRLEKLCIGSLFQTVVSFGVLIFLSNVNTYAETFDMKALSTLRYEAYAGIGICVLIFILSGVYWRKKGKN